MKKTILAFSGGLDTSFCVPYLKKKGFKVVTVTVNTGGFSKKQLKEIAVQSKNLGASKHYEIDAQEELYEKFASYILKANYLKGGCYPACVGPERYLIASEIVKIAKKEESKYVAHGSTAAGNDQVRFDLSLHALLPGCTILAPIRDEGISRTKEIAFLKKHGVKVDSSQKDYSINIGLLGTTIGGKETHSTETALPDSAFPNVEPLNAVHQEPSTIAISFEKGLPVKLNGKKLSGIEIMYLIKLLAEAHGFGKDCHIGTTILGIKGKIGFEAPAMKVLIKAHSELEKIVLTSKQLFWKNILGTLYGDLVHEGLYYDPIAKDLEAFLDSASQFVEGEVEIKLFKGNLTITSMKSKHSLFNNKLGTYGEGAEMWTSTDAKGFCKLYGLESTNAFITHNNHE
ncbi:MAG: argininosuccinate synthase [Patescibacteria group bacterium]